MQLAVGLSQGEWWISKRCKTSLNRSLAVFSGMASARNANLVRGPNPEGIESLSPALRLAAPKRSEGGRRSYAGCIVLIFTTLKELDNFHKALVFNTFMVVRP